ncbi:MAG TPA: hypothetical protein VLX30_08180 [Burkholderiales bacterium]|nr:hypothetical protein [Burkholderiales bacterium]
MPRLATARFAGLRLPVATEFLDTTFGQYASALELYSPPARARSRTCRTE